LTLEEVLQYPEDQENLELKRKIDSITQYCSKPYFKEALKKLSIANPESANIICEYIIAEQNEMNIKESTKEGKIKVLIWLSNYVNKPFGKMTKQDILNYLNCLRRPLSEDPTHKWVGSYNARQMILNKFFRWLYNPDEPDPRKRISPPCMKGVKKLPRQEKSPYKPSNLWDAREHAIFLKYCPSKRDRCYHAIANDMSARPHEILNLKIKDIVFKIAEDGIQYAEVLITGGKTTPRTIPLIDSMPYVKDWIHDHPTGTNPESWLFVSRGNNAFGSKLTYDGLFGQYKYYYKARYFTKLLEDETIPEADKAFIKNMLTKPWNLYIFRHSALTEKSQILKESVLRDHAGWTMTSKMPQVYIHYFGNESSKSLLEARGVMKEKDSRIVALKSKQCPSCNEPNKPDSKFCAKCRMVLTYDAYNETLDKQQQKDNEIRTMKEQIISLREAQKEILECLKYPDKLAAIAREN
jgi:integrase